MYFFRFGSSLCHSAGAVVLYNNVNLELFDKMPF